MDHYLEPNRRWISNNTTSNMNHQHTHVTLASQYFYPATPTYLLPSETSVNTDHGSNSRLSNDLSSNAWMGVRSAFPLTGLGINYQTDIPAAEWNFGGQTCTRQVSGSPMRIDGQGDSFSSPSSIPSINMSDPSISHSPADFSTTLDLAFPLLPSSSSMIIDYTVPLLPVSASPRCSRPHHYGPALSAADNHPTNPIGLIADVNMYDVWLSRASPAPAVNPLDTVGVSSCVVQPRFWVTPELAVPSQIPFKMEPDEDYDTGMLSCEELPSAMDINDLIVWPLSPVEETRPIGFMSPALGKWKIVAAPKQSSLLSPCPKSCYSSDNDLCTPPTPSVRGSEEPTSSPSATMQPSPILNAHLGVELDILMEKAEHFRLRYPDRVIDRSWLLRFAGRLSQRGELMDQFRCYVIGCNQRNKRRDHILVHVGAHVDERPFSCSVW